MVKKLCRTCEEHKELTEFHYAKVGSFNRQSKCKLCIREYTQKRYDEKKEHILELNRRWREENKDYWSDRKPDPTKAKARTDVGNAVKQGKLVKAPCEECGHEVVEAHHDDYNNPLDVRWLCRSCHANWHRFNEVKC